MTDWLNTAVLNMVLKFVQAKITSLLITEVIGSLKKGSGEVDHEEAKHCFVPT